MSSVRLEAGLKEKLRQVAALKGLTESEVHRLALIEFCEREIVRGRTSRYSDVIGIGEGDRQLSARARDVFGEVMDRKHGRHPD